MDTPHPARHAPAAPALWALARPRMLPFVLLLPFIGYCWAHWDRALRLYHPDRLALVLLAWAVLHAGTLWLNAVLDRDQDAVLFGQPVAVPAATAPAGYLALLAAVGLAGLAHPLALAATAGSAALAVLYSHPRTRWKAHPVAGPLVNAVGYGLLSPLAGWAVVGAPANPRTLAAWPLLAIGLLAPTFAAQAFQHAEDAARGYRTLVVTHGPRACLVAARLALLAALAWGMSLAGIGWVPRLCLLGALGWLSVDRWLAAWQRAPAQDGPARAQGLVLRMLGALALTVALAVVDHVHAALGGGPVAGLATAGGWPADMPR